MKCLQRLIQAALNFKKGNFLANPAGDILVPENTKKTVHLSHRYRLGLSSLQSIHHQLLSPWYFAPASWLLLVAIFGSRNVCSKLSRAIKKNVDWLSALRGSFSSIEKLTQGRRFTSKRGTNLNDSYAKLRLSPYFFSFWNSHSGEMVSSCGKIDKGTRGEEKIVVMGFRAKNW